LRLAFARGICYVATGRLRRRRQRGTCVRLPADRNAAIIGRPFPVLDNVAAASIPFWWPRRPPRFGPHPAANGRCRAPPLSRRI